ncbi:MAG: flagellar basal body rod protein FlgB [Legionellales bacterium]
MIGMSVFGLEEKALSLCEERSSMLARNIANSDTPNYKSMDINFQEELSKAHQSNSLKTTHGNHLQGNQADDGHKLYYRIPNQKNQDGNTVDDEIERKNFIENALHYQASLGFAKNRAASLLKAIKGA